jgi:hypothetical protein
MNFADRNAAWNGSPREFHQVNSRGPGTRVWMIRVDGRTIVTSWGILGGKMQVAEEHHDGVNIGKANEKSPQVYAVERAREMCRKKTWEGYREVVLKGGLYMPLDAAVVTEVDFDNLPMSLSFYKPDNSMGAGIEKKARAGHCMYTRKRNGMMKVLVKDSYGELKIYSRRMLRQHDDEQNTEYTWDDRFPHLIHAIEPSIPSRTILLGELAVEVDGRERFDIAQSYIKSLTPKAVAEMQASGLYPFFYNWDIAFWEGENLVGKTTMRDRIARIRALDKAISNKSAFQPLDAYSFATPEEAVEYAKEHGWEGWVVIDPDAVYGDKAFNFKGKPDRPGSACAKLKPTFEDDFIAIWNPDKGFGERSKKGSRAGGIKSVGLYQYNTKGELIFISNVNSGLTKEMLATLADPKLWPQVWRVEYKGRRYMSEGEDTNALDFPAIDPDNYLRTDKAPEECLNNNL